MIYPSCAVEFIQTISKFIITITEEVGRYSDHFSTAACEQICRDKLNRAKQIISAYSFHFVLVDTLVNFNEYIISRLKLTAIKFITAI